MIADFEPHPLLRSPHWQTIIASFGAPSTEQAIRETVPLPDGDAIVLHHDTPSTWRPGDPCALLIHGLCGSHRSRYLVRIAARLRQSGIRTVRMDMRGCGAGVALARYPYHSGRSADIATIVSHLSKHSAGTPLTVIAFSLGANAALKYAAEINMDEDIVPKRVIAVCPPVDLALSVANLAQYPARLYDRYFTAALLRQVHTSPTLGERASAIFSQHVPTRLIDFDDCFTAPLSGFRSAQHYYHTCSSAPRLSAIRCPTTILAAADDPIVPIQPLRDASKSASVQVMITTHGGHLGFIASQRQRWMDACIENLCR